MIQQDEALYIIIQTEEKIEVFLDSAKQTFKAFKDITFETNESKASVEDWCNSTVNLIVYFYDQLKATSPTNSDLIEKAENLYHEMMGSTLENDEKV